RHRGGRSAARTGELLRPIWWPHQQRFGFRRRRGTAPRPRASTGGSGGGGGEGKLFLESGTRVRELRADVSPRGRQQRRRVWVGGGGCDG
ncbi:unnamed protein product, partial [Ectocarpus sp. 12 AP-2014]